jgi:hypothetical protein
MGARTHRNWWKWNSWSVSQTRLLTSTHKTWACTGYMCKGCQGSNQGLNEQETRSIGSPYVDKGRLRAFSKNPSAKKAGKLLNLSRNQLRTLPRLLTGHRHLKGHLFNLGLVNRPKCDRCKQASETASHVLCDCEALTTLRFGHLGHHFMKPGDFEDISQ